MSDGLSAEIPPELSSRDQWICWRNECEDCGTVLDPQIKSCPDCDDARATKRPVEPQTGNLASTNDPSTWGTIEDAEDHDNTHDTHGVGFVFASDDNLVGVDIDDCRDPESGELDDNAQSIVRTLASFTEVSPSGTGLHVYAFGEKPEGGSRSGGVEMYDETRYFTVTGDRIPQSPDSINYRQEEIDAVHDGHIESSTRSGAEAVDFTLEVNPDASDETFTNDLGWPLDQIRDEDTKLDDLLSDLDAGYSSRSEADMATVSKLWFWRFERQTIAKILRTYRRRPKVVQRDDYLELTISKAATGEQYDPRGGSEREVDILDDREVHSSIEDVTIPEDQNFVLDKPPREGGSHATIKHMAEQGPVVILVSRHAIGEHHLEILDKVMPEDKTAVHYRGSSRLCEHGGDCPKRVGGDDFTELFQIEHDAKSAVEKQRIVTEDDVPEQYCKHQFLHFVEKYAHAVVTVPQLLPKLKRNVSGCRILIDEEQALSYFRPPSVNLVNIEQRFEPDGTRTVQVSSSNISDQLTALESIRDQIHKEQRERAEEGDTDQFNETARETDVLAAIDYLEQIAELLGVSDIIEEMDDDTDVTPKSVIDVVRDRLDTLDRPVPNLSPGEFREKIEPYIERHYFDEGVDPGSMIECVLFGYDERPFDFKQTGQSYTLRMIGGREVFHAPTLLDSDQVGIIAGPEGELLFDDLNCDAKCITIDEFRYSDDFIVIPVARKTDDDEYEPPRKQRMRAARVSKLLNDRSHPHLAIAGTKDQANSHHSWLDSGTADIISSPNDPSADIYITWSAGGAAIIYENSAVSRGIDAPPFDISVVASSGFATPYWEARKAHYRGEDDEEYEYADAIESELKSHELTNAVLRPAPTRFIDDITGTKFIVCAEWDVNQLRYLDNVTTTVSSSERAMKLLSQLTVDGGLRAEVEAVHRQVDGSDREFTRIAMEEGFQERMFERPDYTVEEVSKWIENKYFRDPDALHKVNMRGVPPRGEVPQSHIVDLFSNMTAGTVSASLDILERMGVVRSFEEESGGGRPRKFWTKEPAEGGDSDSE